jgi:hypothetical protein
MLKNKFLKTVSIPHIYDTESTFQDINFFDFSWEALSTLMPFELRDLPQLSK